MGNNQEPLKSGKGRHRGDAKSESDICHEDQAKGHKPEEETSKPGNTFERKDRGGKIQKGFGKNQGKEASDITSDKGTRGAGLH
jgi:hypothetical protein